MYLGATFPGHPGIISAGCMKTWPIYPSLDDFIKKHNVRDKGLASKRELGVFSPQRTVTNSAAYINECIKKTIKRLGFTPDLYYLHIIDPGNIKAIVNEIKKLATRKVCVVAQIALAWVAAQGLISILGKTKVTFGRESGISDCRINRTRGEGMRKIMYDTKPIGERFAANMQHLLGN
uniref:NADP-dependent oxidoreductase domain-containing protein n=1 Tax=Bionectria ochroleuca TaxID=29856 RepID=A0A0B7KKV3_BIOOC